jgi:hypothetical protein
MSLPVLRRVVYELFEFEAGILDDPASIEQHLLDRQIRFEMSDGSCWFASWANTPIQYSVGIQRERFFAAGDSVTRDASTHPCWTALIGHPVEFVFVDDRHQVVEVRSPGASVFLSSQENGDWASDVTTVSRSRPEIPQGPLP